MAIPSYLTPGQLVEKFEDLEEDEIYKRGRKMLVIKKFTKHFVRFLFTPDYLNEEPKEYLRKVKEKKYIHFPSGCPYGNWGELGYIDRYFEMGKWYQTLSLDNYWIKNGNYDEKMPWAKKRLDNWENAWYYLEEEPHKYVRPTPLNVELEGYYEKSKDYMLDKGYWSC